MKDQAHMMNQSQMMSMSQPPMLSNQKSQMLINQPQLMNPSQVMMNQSPSQGINQSQMLNRGGYGMWPPVDQLKFQNPMNPPGFVYSSTKPMGRNSNWKGKKGTDKRNRKEKPVTGGSSGSGLTMGGSGGGGYIPPSLKELQQQNRLKARRYFPKKKFNNNRSAPLAPRNTTSFIIRAKKAGGITSLVSPCPVTPAVLPTPIFSPSREVLVDTAKEEWGVDGYGSMKGLIRLRSPGNEAEAPEDEEEEEGGSSESDVEEHLEVERRLDHDLSRFEMIYPNYGEHNNNLLENRVDDQDTHIAQLEEENLILKERLFLMEREFDDLRRRLQSLERQNQTGEEFIEEVVENESDNGSESRGYGRSMEENNQEVVEENNEGEQCVEAKVDNNDGKAEAKEAKNIEDNLDMSENVGVGDDCMEEHMQAKVENSDGAKVDNNDGKAEAKEAKNIEDNLDMSENVGVGDDCLEEHMQAKVENNDGFFEAKEGNNDGLAEEKERNYNGVVEEKQENNAERSNNIGVDDVCMEELGLAQDEVIIENQS